MNIKTTVQKILFIAGWLCIGGGIVTLLLAAISSKRNGVCTNYTIVLKGTVTNSFISKNEVEEVLRKALNGNIIGMPVEKFRLHDLEMLLEKDPWIHKAEIYFDNKNVMHITLEGKEPLARIITTNGTSFYMDYNGGKMPLSKNRTARVPVFTGFPDRKMLSKKDSAFVEQVRNLALYVLKDTFWMSQVAQIHITSNRHFEIVPVIGNHLIKLGDGDNIPAKFRRLMIFYQQVLARTGFDKYKLIDVQYKGQVVAEKYADSSSIDSVQLKKNVERLLQQPLETLRDTFVKTLLPNNDTEPDIILTKNQYLSNDKVTSAEKQNNSGLRLATSNPTAIKKADGQDERKISYEKRQTNIEQTHKTKDQLHNKRKPKAVMPKRLKGEKTGDNYSHKFFSIHANQ